MSKIKLFSVILMLVTLAAPAARSQERLIPMQAANLEPVPAPAPDPEAAATQPTGPITPPGRLSQWNLYQQCGCCGPIGGAGSIHSELYVRGGLTFPTGGSFFKDRIETGWLVQGGLRSLFFDAADIRAWTVDFSLSYTNNPGTGDQDQFLQDGILSTVRDLHRSAVTASLGREYYIIGTAHSCDRHWRVGADAGIRWGTTRLDLNTFDVTPVGFRRVNSTHYGPVIAVHSDIECPIGCCTLIGGVRGEWVDVFNKGLVQLQDNEVMEWNVLLTLGVKY